MHDGPEVWVAWLQQEPALRAYEPKYPTAISGGGHCRYAYGEVLHAGGSTTGHFTARRSPASRRDTLFDYPSTITTALCGEAPTSCLAAMTSQDRGTYFIVSLCGNIRIGPKGEGSLLCRANFRLLAKMTAFA